LKRRGARLAGQWWSSDHRQETQMKAFALSAALMLALSPLAASAQDVPTSGGKTMALTQDWDKVFPKSDRVEHRKVTFKNRYGITLAADLYQPKNASGKLAAIAVGGPFGAVKEQSSGLYAQTMAERGIITLAFDPS